MCWSEAILRESAEKGGERAPIQPNREQGCTPGRCKGFHLFGKVSPIEWNLWRKCARGLRMCVSHHMPAADTPSADRPRPLMKGSDILSSAQWQDVCTRLKLSDRELEVVVGVFDDLKEAAIASRLGISAHTVHTHLERLYRKLGVNGRGRMIIEVLAEHLMSSRERGQ